jgi:hypothetical protein
VALELVLVLVLALPLVGPTQVAAEGPPRASDGRSLAGETPATQALFAAVWGARAAQRWVDEHNAELAGLHAVPDAASAAATSTLPTQTADGAIVTPIAYQPFTGGFMLWRKDNGQLTVGYTALLTKTGAPCQETYQDTYRGQPYDLPPAPTGQLVPKLGFGWLFANDPQLASHLGYATADEVSRVAEIRSRTTDSGSPVLELKLSEPIEGVANPLLIARTDEPGLTYCFPRGSEDRSVLNTWMAIQRFDHGLMRWRQDRPELVEVIHYDTQWAPVANCVDSFRDTWTPGEVLDYGSLAQSGRLLPERGFGKVWLSTSYVRTSLGYPKETEQGGFAEVTFAPIQHPLFGAGLGRRSVVHLASGETYRVLTIFPGGTDPDRETRPSQGCQRLLVPHAS